MSRHAEFDALHAEARGLRKRRERNVEPPAPHRQPFHRCADPVRELDRSEFALRRELARERAIRRKRLALGARERFGVCIRGERGEPAIGFLRQLRQRLWCHAMLARYRVNGGKPFFDTRKLRRIEVEPLAVAAQRSARLVDPDQRFVGQRHDRLE